MENGNMCGDSSMQAASTRLLIGGVPVWKPSKRSWPLLGTKMKQISAVALFAMILFCSCTANNQSSDDSEYVLPYTTYQKEVSLASNPDIHFYVTQVENMESFTIQNEANQTLIEASTEWVDKTCLWLNDSVPEVVYQSERYLTVGRTVILSEVPHFRYITLYVTIDMKTGQRVRLEDFISINEEYALKLKNEYVTYEGYPLFQDWEVAELLEMLKIANMTEAEYLVAHKDNSGSIASLLSYKSAFGFMGERIDLKYNSTWGDFIVINPDDGSFIVDKSYAGG